MSFLFASCLMLPAAPAYGEANVPAGGIPGKRVAFIIGNSNYDSRLALANPKSDAVAFAEVLEKVTPKFRIIRAFDVKANNFKDLLIQFEAELKGAEVGLFYFAGHSIQVAGENYILPVDVPADPALLSELTEDNIVTLFGAARLNDILERMERLSKVKLVFLDACRDNPIAPKQMASTPPEQGAVSRSAGRVLSGSGVSTARQGLAPMSATGSGSLIAFATSPGMTAADGDKHSPFTLALTHHMAEQGVDIQEIMLKVNAEVQERTTREGHVPQIPWVNHSFITKFYLWPWTMEQQLTRLARAEQTELKRLACFSGQPDGKWGAEMKRAIMAFNADNTANIKLDISAPSDDDVSRLVALALPVCRAPTTASDNRKFDAGNSRDSRNARPRAAGGTPSRGGGSPSPSLSGGVGMGGF